MSGVDRSLGEAGTEARTSIPPSPVVVEAASSLIYAAPHVESKGLFVTAMHPKSSV